MRVPAWVNTVRARVDLVRDWAERTIFWRVWERMLENEFVDRSIALGSKAFVSFFPAIIVVSAFSPTSVRASIVATVTRRVGISGAGLATVKSAFASASDTRRATGVVGLIFTFFYVNSFTTALRRIYTKAWRRPKGGVASGYAVGVLWLIGAVAFFAILGALRAVFSTGPETVVYAILAWAAATGVWLLTPWFMLGRQVTLRVLIPTAVLTSTGMLLYAASASVWMPNTVAKNQHQFGFFGVALSLVTWLTGAATIILACACVGPVLVEDTGRIGRLVRGTGPASGLVEGAPPPTAGPMENPTFANALGIGRDDDDDDDDVPDDARSTPRKA